nr:MAG TPA: hypothetical protein [Inoviridae sp.]
MTALPGRPPPREALHLSAFCSLLLSSTTNSRRLRHWTIS